MRNSLHKLVVVCLFLLIATTVRANDYSEIKAAAVRRWPHDKGLQKFEIDRQMKAKSWLDNDQHQGVPTHVWAAIRQQGETLYPGNDYARRAQQLQKQLEAYRRLQSGNYSFLPQRAIEEATNDWPTDYVEQERFLKQQASLYRAEKLKHDIDTERE